MNEKSEQLYERACRRMPGGVNSPVRSFRSVGKTPFFVEKAAGAFLIDADHNRYLDYVCSWGPGILGHAHPAVIEAVRRACEKGLTYGAPTEKEVELAELVHECVPSMEMMRLVSSGTEACMSAIRAARGFTGRDKIVKFEGCYHGHSDGLLVKAGSGLMTESIPDSAGVPAGYAENTLLAAYNDCGSVSRLFDAYRDQIACVIVEPVAANMGVVPPAEGFLSFLREWKADKGTTSTRMSAAAARRRFCHLNLLDRQFNPEAPNKAWVSDITELHYAGGKLYLCVVLDLFSRKVLAARASCQNDTALVARTFETAFLRRGRPRGLLFHSDQGRQYTSDYFRELLEEFSVRQSFSTPGVPYDNAVMESFFASLKKEEYHRYFYKSIGALFDSLRQYLLFYNRQRPHSRLGYQTPEEMEQLYKTKQAASTLTDSLLPADNL